MVLTNTLHVQKDFGVAAFQIRLESRRFILRAESRDRVREPVSVEQPSLGSIGADSPGLFVSRCMIGYLTFRNPSPTSCRRCPDKYVSVACHMS